MSGKGDVESSEITKRLDVLIRLSALNLVREMKVQKDQIALLSDAGFQPKQIADILGTTSNTVSVALSGIRKEREAKAKKETAKPEQSAETTKSGEVTEEEHAEQKGADS
jgi:DNA-binding CsgD family transcriptional regulator